MPSASIATGTPSTLALNNTCPHVNSLPGMPSTAVDPTHIGLFISVKVVPASTGLVASGFTRKLTYGASNIPMTSIAVIDCAGSPINGWIEVFYLQDAISGNGAASVVNYTNRNLADTANVAVKSIELDSATYGHMYQITPNSIQLLAFSGGAANIFINSAKSKYVVGFFACSVAITGASAGTQKSSNNLGTGVGNAANSSIVDAPGDSAVQLTANNGSTGNWGMIAFSIDFIMAATADATKTNYNQIGDTKSILSLQSPPANIGLQSGDYDFSTYPDGNLPADFALTHVGSTTGTLQIQNGLARITNLALTGNSNSYYEKARWGLGQLATDYGEVSCVPANDQGITILIGRTLVQLQVAMGYPTSLIPSNAILTVTDITSTVRTLGSWNLPFIKGARIKLRYGMMINGVLYPYRYQILINDVPQPIGGSGVYYIEDTSHYTQLGPGERDVAFMQRAQGDGILGTALNDMPLTYWGYQDQYFQPGIPVVGRVSAVESTASIDPVQLTTKSDATQVLIGSSSMAEVWLDSYMQSVTLNCMNTMSFDVLAGDAPIFGAANATGYVGANPSGTHTPNALDNCLIVVMDYTSSVTGVTYDGNPMTQIFNGVVVSGVGVCAYLIGITPGAGPKTVAITGSLVDATSISYNGVADGGNAYTTPILTTGTGTALTQPFVNHPNCTLLQVMVANASTTGQGFTSPNKTQRYSKNETVGVNMPMLVQEMPGIFGTVTGSATASPSTTTWGSLIIPILGVHCISASGNMGDGYFLERAQPASILGDKMSSVQLMTGLLPGINTFVPKFCSKSTGAAGTSNFQQRRITVKPL